MRTRNARPTIAIDLEMHHLKTQITWLRPEDVGVVDFDKENRGVVRVGDVAEGNTPRTRPRGLFAGHGNIVDHERIAMALARTPITPTVVEGRVPT